MSQKNQSSKTTFKSWFVGHPVQTSVEICNLEFLSLLYCLDDWEVLDDKKEA